MQRTLSSLAAAHGSPTIEVGVVDDGSREPVADAVDRDGYPFRLEVLRTGGLGLNQARTLGLEATESPAVAFLDDDVSVEVGWVGGAISAMSSPLDLAVAGGRTLAVDPRRIPSWVSSEKMMYLSVVDLGPLPRAFSLTTSPVGANLILRRSWVERVGGFRAGLDRSGASLLSGGDTDLCRRIAAAGGRVLYWPDATVRHHLDPERLTESWFEARAEAQGASDAMIRYADKPPSTSDLAFELIRPLRAGGIAAKRMAARRSTIDARLWLHSSRGRWRAIRAART